MNTLVEPLYDQTHYVRIDPSLLSDEVVDKTIAIYEKSFHIQPVTEAPYVLENQVVILHSKKVAAYLTCSMVTLGQTLDVLG